MDRIAVLRAFVRLVEKGSFTAVADELRVKQSTISKWVAALEDELGAQLPDRTTRSQRVTDVGQRFYEHAARVVAAFDEAVADVRRGDAELRGRIRLSLPVVFGRLFIVPLVTRFLRQHQEIAAELAFSDRYVSLVEEGFDLAIRIGVPVDSSLRSHRLGESSRRLVAAPRYLKAHGTPKVPRDLAEHECLVHTRLETSTTWAFRGPDRTHRASVRGRVCANNSEATLALVRAGLGVGLLASWLVDSDLRSGRLVPLLTDYALSTAQVRGLTAPGRHLAPHLRALIAHLRTGLASAPGME